MASSSVGMACLLLVSCMVVPSLAKVYTVGDASGWTTGVDYSTWTSGKTFKVGDSLVFNYPTSHTVDEVSSSDYSTCTVGNAITTDNSGATTVALKKAGTHYFICGVVGHCGNGMKLAVKVESGSAPAPAPSKSKSKSSAKSPSSSTASSPPSSDKPSTTTPSTTTATTKAADSSSWSLSPFVAVVTAWVALFLMVIS
ncbi:Blue copper protein [Hibiscus syriacus]|uniref:Blue copper protein n=2 Tax=Hibiscus syriacus TaxID=106335 RepID=A0A6A2WJQ1_HIBSY|nr:Blue copper protein [Hibiscus syriacus]